jgi:hypothetical protein
MVDKVALGLVSSQYLGFPCQLSFHRLLHTHHLSSGAGTIGQLVADVPSGLSLTPPQETKKKTKVIYSNFNHFLIFKFYKIYSVTCQPIVGLRNRGYATRFQALAGEQDFGADAMTSRNSIGIRFLRNMPRWRHTHQE